MEISLDSCSGYDWWEENVDREVSASEGLHRHLFNLGAVGDVRSLSQRVKKDILFVGHPRGNVKAGVSVEWGGSEKPKGRVEVEPNKDKSQ